MNKILLLSFFLISLSSYSQNIVRKTYTIEVNENMATTLIFKDAIKSGRTGHRVYNFTYDKTGTSPVGLIQGIKGPNSNLTVITQNGNLYNFILKYSKQSVKATHFLTDSLAEGNISGRIIYSEALKKEQQQMIEDRKEALRRSKPLMLNDRSGETTIVLAKEEKEEDSLYVHNRQEYIRKYASNMVSKRDYYLRKYASQNGVYFHLKDYAYNKNELYFAFKVDNESGLDFDVREVEMGLQSKDNSKNTSSQTLEIKPIMIYNQPNRVEGHRKSTFVYVFDKFSIGDKKSIICTLVEDNGERNIILTLDEKTINNPN